jgi:hypothetical protein
MAEALQFRNQTTYFDDDFAARHRMFASHQRLGTDAARM